MKLYLSSYQLGNEPEKLVALIGENKRVAVICNAIDSLDGTEREVRVERELSALKSLGLQPEELDLRHYFGKLEAIEKKLSEFGTLWIRGGNVFILRKAMALSGFDGVIRRLLDKGIVYAGYSAASCVAGPTLHGIELCDDINLVPEKYPQETIWEGLHLIDFTVAPHYKSNHPESPLIDKVVDYFEQNRIPYKTLRDGEAIIIDE
jgi:dipeptidase E